jgi:MFS family permease
VGAGAPGPGVTWLRGPLASRNFRLLVACDVTSSTGSAMAYVAIPFAVLRSGGSASDIGFVTAAALVPTIIFLLFGGVLADRLPRQQVMVAANVVQGLAQALFAALVLAGHPHLWQMMALSGLRGCGGGLYLPASQGLVPQTVPEDQLGPANAIRRVGLNSAMIGGSALGGAVVALAGPGWGLVADAASFAVAAALRAGMRFAPIARTGQASMLTELLRGWQAFTSYRWLWTIVVQFSLVNAIFSGAFGVLGPVVADRHLGGAGSWGAILAADSIGAVLGASAMVRYRPQRLLLVGSIAVMLFTLPLFALAMTYNVPLIAVAALASGVGTEVFEVNWSVALQEQVPLDMLSRVSSYDALGSNVLRPVGTSLAGPVAEALGITGTLVGGGIVTLVSVFVILCVPEVRKLRRKPPVAADRGQPGPGG